MFGHEAGAFTGAVRRRNGRFEAAHNGTLFLDELGTIPMQTQEKILRAIEYGSFQRVGGAELVRVDVRIVGATNADLPALAEEGRFMRDLLDRLSFEVLFLPPLRERREDILLLAQHFAARMAFELGRSDPPEFSGEVIAAIESYPWRGNVRELKNVIERAVYRSDSPRLEEIDFDPFQSPYGAGPAAGGAAPAVPPVLPPKGRTADFKETIGAMEAALVRDALRRARHHQHKAAQLLGLTYHQFRGLYRKHKDRLQAPAEG